MATYAFIHGGGDSALYWHALEPGLRARGHATVSMDLPCEDDSATFADYADAAVAALPDGDDTGYPGPEGWMRGVVRDRLGIEPDEIEAGHCVALSRPRELAERLETYRVAEGLS